MGEILDVVLNLIGGGALKLINMTFKTNINLGYWGKTVLGLFFALVVIVIPVFLAFVMSTMFNRE